MNINNDNQHDEKSGGKESSKDTKFVHEENHDILSSYPLYKDDPIDESIDDFSEDVLKASYGNNHQASSEGDVKEVDNSEISIESRVQALMTTQQNNNEKEFRELISSVSNRRLASDKRHDKNSEIIGNALEVSRQYEELTEDQTKPKKFEGVLKTIKALLFIKSKPPVNYVEKQAGLSVQVIELEKRMETAINEIHTDNQELLGIRNRLEVMLERISEEIDEIKTLMGEMTYEIRGLQKFILEHEAEDGFDIPEVVQAKARLAKLNHSLTRLDRKLMSRQTEYTSMSMNINNITSDIDGNIDQIDGLNDTKTNLLRLIESASIAYAEDRKLERAVLNSRTRDAINSTLLSFEQRRTNHAEKIALQIERPSYDIEVLGKMSDLRQEAEQGRERIRVGAAKARQDARKALAGIMSKESIHSTQTAIIDSRSKMLLVKPETSKKIDDSK